MIAITRIYLARIFISFKIKNYRYLWASDCLQAWAEYMELIVLSWLILEISSSPLLVGLYGALRFMGTIMSPIFGVIVDKFDRKILLVLIRGSFALNGIVILCIAFAGVLTTTAILIMAGFLGLSKTFDMVRSELKQNETKPKQPPNCGGGRRNSTTPKYDTKSILLHFLCCGTFCCWNGLHGF